MEYWISLKFKVALKTSSVGDLTKSKWDETTTCPEDQCWALKPFSRNVASELQVIRDAYWPKNTWSHTKFKNVKIVLSQFESVGPIRNENVCISIIKRTNSSKKKDPNALLCGLKNMEALWTFSARAPSEQLLLEWTGCGWYVVFLMHPSRKQQTGEVRCVYSLFVKSETR